MTIGQGHYFGMNVERTPDARGKMYLAFVIWYPVARNRLGYWYPAIRWF